MKLIAMICFDNYYSQFYHHFCVWVDLTPLVSHFPLLQISLISLRISEFNVSPLLEIFLLESDQQVATYNFSIFQQRPQPHRRQALEQMPLL
jgi:hypothetical protein